MGVARTYLKPSNSFILAMSASSIFNDWPYNAYVSARYIGPSK